VPRGSPCAVHCDCVAGMLCLDRVCRELCRVDGGTFIQGTACVSVGLRIGATSYGGCV